MWCLNVEMTLIGESQLGSATINAGAAGTAGAIHILKKLETHEKEQNKVFNILHKPMVHSSSKVFFFAVRQRSPNGSSEDNPKNDSQQTFAAQIQKPTREFIV